MIRVRRSSLNLLTQQTVGAMVQSLMPLILSYWSGFAGLTQEDFEVLKIERLDQMIVEAGFSRLTTVIVLTIPSDGNQEGRAVCLVLPKASGNFVAINTGQPDVEENHVGVVNFGRFEGIKARMSDVSLVP